MNNINLITNIPKTEEKLPDIIYLFLNNFG